MSSFDTSPATAEIFFKSSKLKSLKLNTEKINLACTFLLKVKDKNYLEIKSYDPKPKTPYMVIVYEGDNMESAKFSSKKDAEWFVETLNFINESSMN